MTARDHDNPLVLWKGTYRNWQDILDEIPAGTYYVTEDDGNIYPSESEAERACWEIQYDENGVEVPNADGSDEPEWVQTDTYVTLTVDPWYICRDHPYDRIYPCVVVVRAIDDLPSSMLAPAPSIGFKGNYDEFRTRDEAIKAAHDWAKRWSEHTDDFVTVCTDRAIVRGDDLAVYRHGQLVPEKDWPEFL